MVVPFLRASCENVTKNLRYRTMHPESGGFLYLIIEQRADDLHIFFMLCLHCDPVLCISFSAKSTREGIVVMYPFAGSPFTVRT